MKYIPVSFPRNKMNVVVHKTYTYIVACTMYHYVHLYTCAKYILSYLCSLEGMKWSAELTSVQVKPFSGNTGPQVPLPSSPLGIFSLFFTTSLLQYIMLQSNQCALECMGGEKFGQWTHITIEELRRTWDLWC